MTRRRALLASALASTLAFVVLAGIARHGGVLPAERSVQSLVQAERTPALDWFIRRLTVLGAGSVSIPLSIVVVVLLVRRDRELAMFFAAVSAGGHLLSPVAKFLVNRPRPRLTGYGFPSGHTLAAVVVFGALIYVARVVIRQRSMRWLGMIVCGAAIVGVAFSRLYLNSHWTIDVAGGLAGGTAVLLFGIVWFEGRGRS